MRAAARTPAPRIGYRQDAGEGEFLASLVEGTSERTAAAERKRAASERRSPVRESH
jgi:hypothetical protein